MQQLFRRFERLVDPFPATAPTPPPAGLLAFCLHYMRGMGWALGVVAALSTVLAILEVSLFGFLGQLVDWLSTQSREDFLAQQWRTLALLGALVLVGIPAVVLLQSLFVHQTLIGNFAMRVRWQAHNYLLSQSLAFFQDEMAGGVATKLMQTALAVRESVTKLVDLLVYVCVYFVSILVLVGLSDIRLVAPLALWLVAYVALLRLLIPRLQRTSARQADARSLMTGRVVDTYTNIATVKLFSHSQREASYAHDGMRQFLNTVHPQMRLVTLMSASIWAVNAVLIFSVSALSIWLWLEAAVSTGAIAVAIALCLRLNGMSQWIMWEVSGLFENIGTVRDGINLLSRRPAVVDAPDATPFVPDRGRIEFSAVRFAYPGQAPVFDGLDLDIRPGEKVGLVGRSGAGKSTLVSLLLRFYDVQGGAVRVDGQDLRRVTQESLRAAIGMVTQDTSLLHRSIRDNIAYGRPGATEAEVIAAARRAEAWEFVQEIVDPQGRRGLDALVGDRGVRLSGGQRQRIAIARVMLKDAPILVLDEATSALDSEVEAAIQTSLGRLMEGKTVIAIAHRLSTIAAMDRLIVLDEGRVVEEGRHADLIALGGIYSRLWSHQSGGFIAEDLAGGSTDAAAVPGQGCG
jgi:ATP-binding cassette subfamily B multidrug efflux pump